MTDPLVFLALGLLVANNAGTRLESGHVIQAALESLVGLILVAHGLLRWGGVG